jgi:sugar lactone lactonase YvrE
MRGRTAVPLLALAALALYLGYWPVPVKPVAWHAPAAPGYTGAHAPNARLAGIRRIDLHGETGPEHVLLGPDGKLYTGTAGGHVLRMEPDGSAQTVFADTAGRPLGMAFRADGDLIVADALRGLLAIGPDGKARVLADTRSATPLHFANAVAVADDGKIYVTDSSVRFSAKDWGTTMEAALLDIIEQSATGRVLEYDPATDRLRTVATGLSLANGIVLSSDQSSAFVAESGRYRIWKIALTADAADLSVPSRDARVVLDNLPGYPDNLTRGADGRIWAGLAGQRNALDALAARPALRAMVARLPRPLRPSPKPYGHVFAFTEDGTVVADLQDPTGNSPATTGLTETAGRSYVHAVDGSAIGVIER